MGKAAAKNKANNPRGLKTEDEAERLFQAYLETFQQAPESDSLLKRYFFSMYLDNVTLG